VDTTIDSGSESEDYPNNEEASSNIVSDLLSSISSSNPSD